MSTNDWAEVVSLDDILGADLVNKEAIVKQLRSRTWEEFRIIPHFS